MNTPPRRHAVAFIFFSSNKNWHGGKNYYRALFGALHADLKCQVQVYAFIGKKADPMEFDFPPSVKCVQLMALDRWSPSWFLDKVAQRFVGIPFFLQHAFRKHGVKVLSHCDPRDAGSLPCISWIPDFQHVHLPQFFLPKDISSRNLNFKRVLKNANIVVVSSAAAYADLVRFFPEHAEKGRVLRFCAIQPNLGRDSVNVSKRYGLRQPFFYIPNQMWAHKNHSVAIEVLAKLHERWPTLQIVCSGSLIDDRNSKHINELRTRIEELGLIDRFILLGEIPYPHIAQLMVQALAVINPSYFEGWSTTVEEAKSMGVPLVLSDIPVHREQCTLSEAQFFPPDDHGALAACLVRLLISDNHISANQVGFESALETHRIRMLEFARNYQSIVGELVHYGAGKRSKRRP